MVGVSRRTILRLLGTIPFFSRELFSQTSRRGAIFLPGITGSTLATKGNARQIPIWSKEVSETYKTLTISSNRLRYTGNPAQYIEILEQSSLFGFSIAHYYSKILKLLKASAAFGIGERLCLIPYDWRRSIVTTADACRDQVANFLGASTLAQLNAENSKIDQIDIVAHSMGALVALLLISQKDFPTEKLRSIILIAPPLAGAPRAFRNLFDSVSMPFLDDIIGRWWGRNGTLACDALHDVFGTFESLYEMMPPADVLYINTESSGLWSNPLTGHSRMRMELCQKAQSTHQLLAEVLKTLPVPKRKMHLFTGIGIDTDNRYYVRQSSATLPHGTPYTMQTKPEITSGDGTVTFDSSTWHSQLVDKANHYPIVSGAHSQLCENDDVVGMVEQILA